MLADPQSAIYAKLRELYSDDEQVERAAEFCGEAVDEFGRVYGTDRQAVIVRATGRINLMGMHIDHRGGSVNPIAIKEVFFVAEPREDDTIVIRNVEDDAYPEERFRIRECLPEGKIRDWDRWSHEELEKRKNDLSITWSNYVRAAVLYLQHLHTRDDGTFDPTLRGMNVMVYGSIPRAAGLSTSSSIVVASLDAALRINGLTLEGKDFIDACGTGEWYVGTRGGSGDHAAIKFGRPNSILHMKSLPLAVKTLPFPAGYKIVLANSLVEAKKQAGARDAFNSRVASYIFGLMLTRKRFPEYAPKLERLRDINPTNLGIDDRAMYEILRALPERATREEVLTMLPDEEESVRHVFRSHAEPPDGYKIRQVCLFGIAECIRSDMAAAFLHHGDIQGFGDLINISHEGDRLSRPEGDKRVPVDGSIPDEKIDSLIADLESGDTDRVERARFWRQPGGYECSCEEIDVLVDAAMSVEGTIAARLVGAGLGGSMMAIVREEQAQSVIDQMVADYYGPRYLRKAIEVVQPVGGAGVIEVD